MPPPPTTCLHLWMGITLVRGSAMSSQADLSDPGLLPDRPDWSMENKHWGGPGVTSAFLTSRCQCQRWLSFQLNEEAGGKSERFQYALQREGRLSRESPFFVST